MKNKSSQALILFVLLFSSSLFSQQLSQMSVVGRAEIQSSELVAKEVRDANGEICAGLIIATDLDGLKFDSYNGIVKINADKPGKYFLFLSPDERVVTLYKTGFKPLKIILSEYGIAKMQSGKVWQLNVTGEKKLDVLPITILMEPSDATIFIDNKNKGIDKTQEVALGKHELRIEKEGFKTYSQIIEVTSKNVLFNVKLQEVELTAVQIRTVPTNAKIVVNNTERGVTDKGLFLYPGKYQLKLTLNGYVDVEQQIVIEENGKNAFSYTLEKNIGVLQFSITPSDAKILVNKEEYVYEKNIELAPGKYKVEIQKEGYNSQGETIDLSRGVTIVRKYNLIPKTGTLQFSVTPLNAKVQLQRNGVIIYEWIGLKIQKEIQTGKYNIFCTAKGYKNLSKEVSIDENNTRIEDITLIKEDSSAELSEYSSDSIQTKKVKSETPTEYSLKQNYPNPFNSYTEIEFAIPDKSYILLSVFDMLGLKKEVVLDGKYEAGWHKVRYEPKEMSSGVYYYRIEAISQLDVNKRFEKRMKMLYLK